MCAPSPPDPPDYRGAAEEQGQANLEAARATGKLNNPNVYNPYGTQIITFDGDQPTVRQTFSPEQQALYEQSTRVKQQLGQLGEQGATALESILGRNLDLSGLPALPGGGEATRERVINAMMGRANRGFSEREDQVRSDLVAAGIRPGTEAYDREMRRIDEARNDARMQAELTAGTEAQRDFGMGMDARQRVLAEMLAGRQTPLNEITALMSGSQVSNPFAGGLGYQAGANVQAAPLFQATQALGDYNANLYNAKAGSWGNMMSGLFGGAGTAIGGL